MTRKTDTFEFLETADDWSVAASRRTAEGDVEMEPEIVPDGDTIYFEMEPITVNPDAAADSGWNIYMADIFNEPH
ncbi:MAG: hypothetical protein AAFV86_16580 [Pseudomonadota bacterium]